LHLRTVITVLLLLGGTGCSDTHDYVGMWCGSVDWSWKYTYFDTEYEEDQFRVDNTCWLVGRTQQSLTMKETLSVGLEDTPDGWCRLRAPAGEQTSSARSFSTDSECAFLMSAQDQEGDIFTLEQFWRLTDGEMDLQNGQLSVDASFAAATYFDGNELWGTATATYFGTIAPGFEPIDPAGGLQEQRESCALDGCWQGSFVGNVVTGPAACETLLETYSFDGTRFDTNDNGTQLVVNGESVPTFPYLQSCEVVGKTNGISGEEWTYRLNEGAPGSIGIEIELSVPAPSAGDEFCELYWQSTAGMCPQ